MVKSKSQVVDLFQFDDLENRNLSSYLLTPKTDPSRSARSEDCSNETRVLDYNKIFSWRYSLKDLEAALRSDPQAWNLEPCCPTWGSCLRMRVSDLIKIRPSLSEETAYPEILAFVDNETAQRKTTLQPWLQKVPMTDREHSAFLEAIEVIDSSQIEALFLELRNASREASGYAEFHEKRIEVRLLTRWRIVEVEKRCRSRIRFLNTKINTLYQSWNRSKNATDPTECQRLQQVISRLFQNYYTCARMFWALAMQHRAIACEIDPADIRKCMILMLTMESQGLHTLRLDSPCVFTLVEAKAACAVIASIPKNSFDLKQYRSTYHSLSDVPTLSSDMALFRRRLNVFLTGDPENNPLRDVNWNAMAVTGSVLTWALPDASMRSDLTKDQELEQLYARSDLDLPCQFLDMGDFLEHVRNTIATIEQNLDHPGTYQMHRSAKIYVEHPDLTQINTSRDQDDLDQYRAILTNSRRECRSFAKNEFDLAFFEVPDDQIDVAISHLDTEALCELIARTTEGEKTIPGCWFSYPMDDTSKFKIPTASITNPSRWITYSRPNRKKTKQANQGNNRIYVSQLVKIRYTNNRLTRPLEFYMVHKNLIAHVSGYHFECVRALYDGSQVYLTTGALIAYATGNVFAPWGIQTSSYSEIVTKYANRGFRIKYCDDQQDPDRLRGNDDEKSGLRGYCLVQNV